MASCRVGRFSAGNHSAWPARNSGGAVYLFWFLAAAADAFGRLHDPILWFVQIPVQMDIENFDVSPFLFRGVIALSLLYAAYASQTLRGALKAVPVGQWGIWSGAGPSKSAIFLSGDAADAAGYALPGSVTKWPAA